MSEDLQALEYLKQIEQRIKKSIAQNELAGCREELSRLETRRQFVENWIAELEKREGG